MGYSQKSPHRPHVCPLGARFICQASLDLRLWAASQGRKEIPEVQPDPGVAELLRNSKQTLACKMWIEQQPRKAHYLHFHYLKQENEFVSREGVTSIDVFL